jgi:hypothetical protein
MAFRLYDKFYCLDVPKSIAISIGTKCFALRFMAREIVSAMLYEFIEPG